MFTLLEVKTDFRSEYIDESVMQEIKDFMGEEGESTIRELIAIYLANTPPMIARIKKDLLENDLESLKAHVHSLKGSSASVGIVGISKTCKMIEELIKIGKIDEISKQFEQIESIYAQVEMDLRERL
jgi:HPt (histidine-containing phosphotransfer) domain-containing protein